MPLKKQKENKPSQRPQSILLSITEEKKEVPQPRRELEPG